MLSGVLGFGGSLARYLAYYFIGMLFNLFLPTSVGGDVVRAWYLRRPGRITQFHQAGQCGLLPSAGRLPGRLRGALQRRADVAVAGLCLGLLLSGPFARRASGQCGRHRGGRRGRAAGPAPAGLPVGSARTVALPRTCWPGAPARPALAPDRETGCPGPPLRPAAGQGWPGPAPLGGGAGGGSRAIRAIEPIDRPGHSLALPGHRGASGVDLDSAADLDQRHRFACFQHRSLAASGGHRHGSGGHAVGSRLRRGCPAQPGWRAALLSVRSFSTVPEQWDSPSCARAEVGHDKQRQRNRYGEVSP